MRASIIATLLVVFTASAVAAPEFTRYYAKDPTTEGTGGEMKTVDGIEFWSNGSPPRKFEVLGFLEDTRHKSGIYGAIRMSSLEKEIADAARANGGEAVILVGANTDVVGIVSSGGAFGSGNAYGHSANATAFGYGASRPVEKQETKYAVIRYVDATSAPQAAPAPISAAPTQSSVPTVPPSPSP